MVSLDPLLPSLPSLLPSPLPLLLPSLLPEDSELPLPLSSSLPLLLPPSLPEESELALAAACKALPLERSCTKEKTAALEACTGAHGLLSQRSMLLAPRYGCNTPSHQVHH